MDETEASHTPAPPRRDIAPTVVFDTKGRLLLQLRDDKPGILFPGMIGLFGGHREGDETFLECAIRELEEELSYHIPPERFEHIATREGRDSEIAGGVVCAEIFIVRDVPVEKLTITEGSLLIVEVSEFDKIEHRLTPSARFALERALPDRGPRATS